MKKYFMAGTDEEILIGDFISVELEKDFGDGRTVRREIGFKVTEDSIDDAVELGILDVKEVNKHKRTVRLRRKA